jgi:hypothetical protein
LDVPCGHEDFGKQDLFVFDPAHFCCDYFNSDAHTLCWGSSSFSLPTVERALAEMEGDDGSGAATMSMGVGLGRRSGPPIVSFAYSFSFSLCWHFIASSLDLAHSFALTHFTLLTLSWTKLSVYP